MKQTLTYLKLYLKIAWLPALLAAAALLLLALLLPNNHNKISFLNSAAILLAFILQLYLCHSFYTLDLYLLSTGVTPLKRLASLFYAYVLSIFLLCIIVPLTLHFHFVAYLFSFFQPPPNEFTVPFKPFISAYICFAFMILALSLAFVEIHMRALAGYTLLERIPLFMLGLISFPGAVFAALNTVRWVVQHPLYAQRPPSDQAFAFILFIAFLTRLWPLFQLPYHSTHLPGISNWRRPNRTPMPLGTRIADAILVLCLSCILLGFTFKTPFTLSTIADRYITYSENLPWVYAANAALAAVLFFAIVMVARDKIRLAYIAFAIAALLVFFPVQYASRSLIGPRNIALEGSRITINTNINTNKIQILIDSKIYPSDVPATDWYSLPTPAPLRFKRSLLTPPNPAPPPYDPQDETRRHLLLSQSPLTRTTQRFIDPTTRVMHEVQVKIGPDTAYINEKPPLACVHHYDTTGTQVNVTVSPLERRRRALPLYAWWLSHPNAAIINRPEIFDLREFTELANRLPEQDRWLNLLLLQNDIPQQTKVAEITLAIQLGYLPQDAINILHLRPEPWLRALAVDAMIRQPGSGSLPFLSSLTHDPDPAVAARAKAGAKFITRLKSLPLNQLPRADSPESITFFDLTP